MIMERNCESEIPRYDNTSRHKYISHINTKERIIYSDLSLTGQAYILNIILNDNFLIYATAEKIKIWDRMAEEYIEGYDLERFATYLIDDIFYPS